MPFSPRAWAEVVAAEGTVAAGSRSGAAATPEETEGPLRSRTRGVSPPWVRIPAALLLRASAEEEEAAGPPLGWVRRFPLRWAVLEDLGALQAKWTFTVCRDSFPRQVIAPMVSSLRVSVAAVAMAASRSLQPGGTKERSALPSGEPEGMEERGGRSACRVGPAS